MSTKESGSKCDGTSGLPLATPEESPDTKLDSPPSPSAPPSPPTKCPQSQIHERSPSTHLPMPTESPNSRFNEPSSSDISHTASSEFPDSPCKQSRAPTLLTLPQIHEQDGEDPLAGTPDLAFDIRIVTDAPSAEIVLTSRLECTTTAVLTEEGPVTTEMRSEPMEVTACPTRPPRREPPPYTAVQPAEATRNRRTLPSPFGPPPTYDEPGYNFPASPSPRPTTRDSEGEAGGDGAANDKWQALCLCCCWLCFALDSFVKNTYRGGQTTAS